MTIDEALRQQAKRLSLCSSTPRLDADVLLTHSLNTNRTALLAHADEEVSEDALARFMALTNRRAEGEPVAYLTGHKEFYGLDFVVTRDVLVPRPETESVVEACLEILGSAEESLFADIGTGSGAILISVATQRPGVRAYGTEISPGALAVARQNCEAYGLSDRVTLLLGNLPEPLPQPVEVIAANLPYVPPDEAAPDVARWEPKVAVFGGGPDGTSTIREFLGSAPRYLLPGGAIVMEVAYSQGRTVARLAENEFPNAKIEVRRDLAGYDRIVIIKT